MRRANDKAHRLKRIAMTIASCAQCRYKSLGKPVAADGNPDARLVFVGEAPGKREAALGLAFQGRAGKFLRQALHHAGIQQAKVLFLNALKYMPTGTVPSVRAIRHGRLHLLDQLAVVEPDIVVLMGSTAARAVFDRRISVTNEHGRLAMRPGDRVRYFITVHPSAAVRFPATRKLFLDDLQQLAEISNQHSCILECCQQEVV